MLIMHQGPSQVLFGCFLSLTNTEHQPLPRILMLRLQMRKLRLRVKHQPKVWGSSQSRIQNQVGGLTTSCLAGVRVGWGRAEQ